MTPPPPRPRWASRTLSVALLVLLSMLGTLARTSLAQLTTYPTAPIRFASLWPNFAGCVVMGFLLGSPPASASATSSSSSSSPTSTLRPAPASPLYLGLTVGFCGSLTSFSAFARDAFLALASTQLEPPASSGRAAMAVAGIVLATLALAAGGVAAGMHFAAGLDALVQRRRRLCISDRVYKALSIAAAAGALGAWAACVVLSSQPLAAGRIPLALSFSPPGCVLRWGLARGLNARRPGFPPGTFAANMLGTAVLGAAWVGAHVGVGAGGCVVLGAGVEDGFCGCLTTVSTWAVELRRMGGEPRGLRRAYVYGGASVAAGLGLLVVIMGSLQWTRGVSGLAC